MNNIKKIYYFSLKFNFLIFVIKKNKKSSYPAINIHGKI